MLMFQVSAPKNRSARRGVVVNAELMEHADWRGGRGVALKSVHVLTLWLPIRTKLRRAE